MGNAIENSIKEELCLSSYFAATETPLLSSLGGPVDMENGWSGQLNEMKSFLSQSRMSFPENVSIKLGVSSFSSLLLQS